MWFLSYCPNNSFHVLINKSGIIGPTKNVISEFQDNHTIFQESVDNFEIAHKTCPILVWGAVPSYGTQICWLQ